jgi:hypothetical protein
MLLDIGIILGCCTILFLMYKVEDLDRKFLDIKGRMEFIWRKFKNLDSKDNK